MELSKLECDFLRWYRTLSSTERLAVRCYLLHDDDRLLAWFGQCRETLYSFTGSPLTKRQDKFTLLFG